MTTVVDVRALRVHRAHRPADELLHDVTFRLEAGRALALVGASGSGKSLTLLALMRLLPPSLAAAASSVRLVRGIDVNPLRPDALPAWRAATFGFVPASPGRALDPLRTIGQQGRVVQSLLPVAARTIDAMLRLVGFADARAIATRFPHQLSGGEHQRAALALALLRDPTLVVIDEPTAALDALSRQEVIALLTAVRTQIDTSILMVTHDLDVATAIADDAVLMHDGYTVDAGPPRALWQHGRHSATRAFAAAWPRLPDVWTPPPRRPTTPLLAVEHLTVRYGTTTAVDDVSVTVHDGERVAIVGRSGSGKSTLIAALAGAPRRAVQWVVQDAGQSLDPRLTVGRSLVEARRAHGERDADGDDARVHRVLAEVGLAAPFTDRFPHELSTGQQQRVAIARALILDPRCLILDEPVSALDPVSAARIVELLARLGAARELTIVFVTHDMARVPQVADRVVVMHEGRVVEDGPTVDVLTRPSHRITQALVDAQRRAAAQ